MVTHEEMVEAFGTDGILLMDAHRLREIGVSDEDARILCEVGLPVRSDEAFTTLLEDEPSVGSVIVFKTSKGDFDVLVLGGTAERWGMRYFLDLGKGHVGLLSLGEEPQTGRANTSLAVFVEFLHRLRLRQEAVNGEEEDVSRRHTERLRLSLEELDPRALGSAESWWSMVMDNLMKRDFIEETRAFLQQRRAEVARS
ncbi:SUKH-4 family immunity protein [Nonomuraea sp. NPDC046802]|uniref:SUKH-4 family immunity protein n=1 Tax=Nonomuraea sp. NPDC046802 TaxID=3154919 RepID=UPI00340E9552